MPHKDPITTIGLAASLLLFGLALYLYLPEFLSDKGTASTTTPAAPSAEAQPVQASTPTAPAPQPVSEEKALQTELQRILDQVEKLEQENNRLAQEIDQTEQESQQLDAEIENIRPR